MELPPLSLAGNATLEETSLSYRAQRDAPASMRTVGVGFRLVTLMTASSYAGGEMELGEATTSAPVIPANRFTGSEVYSQNVYHLG